MSITPYKEKQLQPDEVLFSEGGKCDFVYLIKSGEFITVREKKGRLSPTGIHREQDFMGIIASVEKSKYVESAISRATSIVIPIPSKDLGSAVGECADWIEKLIGTLTERLNSSINLLHEHKILDDFDEFGESYTTEEEATYRNKLKDFNA